MISFGWAHAVQEQRKLRHQASVERKAGEGAAGAPAQSKRSQSWRRLLLLLRHYWHRLAGAALGWFAWDFYYCASPTLGGTSRRTFPAFIECRRASATLG